MSFATDVELDAIQKTKELGKIALQSLFPKDFSAALVAIELVDSNGATVDYFSWPVLPSEIREVHNELTNVRKTIGGVYVLKNTTFNPRQISLRGTFGRKFRILLNNKQIELAGFRFSMANGKFKISTPFSLDNTIPQFSSFAKNGYGCIKVIEAIKEKSKQLDGYGRPHSVYFYNPILGNNYLVEFVNFSHMQDENQHNMLPAYSIQLIAVAPLDGILSRWTNVKSALRNLSITNLQKTANALASSVRSVVLRKLR